MRERRHSCTLVASAAAWPREASPSSHRPGFSDSFRPVKVNVDDWSHGKFSPFIGLSHCIMAPHWQNSWSLVSKKVVSIESVRCPMAFVCWSASVQRWGARRAKSPLFQTPTVFGGEGREEGAGIAKVPLYVPQHISPPPPPCVS